MLQSTSSFHKLLLLYPCIKCVLKILFRIDGVFIDHLGIVMNVKRLQRRLPLFFTRHWGGVESLNWDKYDIDVILSRGIDFF